MLKLLVVYAVAVPIESICPCGLTVIIGIKDDEPYTPESTPVFVIVNLPVEESNVKSVLDANLE